MAPEGIGYAEMNDVADQAPIGAAGVSVIPFGNGAERVLQNKEVNCSIHGVNFLTHNKSHLLRAAQEGIATLLPESAEPQSSFMTQTAL